MLPPLFLGCEVEWLSMKWEQPRTNNNLKKERHKIPPSKHIYDDKM